MKPPIWILGCLAAWLLSLPVEAQSWNDASVKIWNRRGGMASVGSGTIIGSNGEVGLVVTVKHLFREGVGEIVVRRRDGHGYRGKIWAVSECDDLAAIVIQDTGDLPEVMVSRQQPRAAIMAGFGSGFRVQQGRFREVSNKGDVFYTFHPADGDSGGGLFAYDGSLVGVVWGRDDEGGATVGAEKLFHFLSHPDNLWAFMGPDDDPEEDDSPDVELSSFPERRDQIPWSTSSCLQR